MPTAAMQAVALERGVERGAACSADALWPPPLSTCCRPARRQSTWSEWRAPGRQRQSHARLRVSVAVDLLHAYASQLPSTCCPLQPYAPALLLPRRSRELGCLQRLEKARLPLRVPSSFSSCSAIAIDILDDHRERAQWPIHAAGPHTSHSSHSHIAFIAHIAHIARSNNRSNAERAHIPSGRWVMPPNPGP